MLPEIEQLMRCVEQRYGSVLCTTTDFEVFSIHLKRTTSGELSASTLKRLWGYVSDGHQPRRTTLDILAAYAGHESYASFVQWLKTQRSDNSEFVDMKQIVSTELAIGDQVRIGWSPDRLLLLSYRGDNSYVVVESRNSKILAGDAFYAGCFVKHQPLLLPYLLRNGRQTPPFLAGREGGLTVLEKLS